MAEDVKIIARFLETDEIRALSPNDLRNRIGPRRPFVDVVSHNSDGRRLAGWRQMRKAKSHHGEQRDEHGGCNHPERRLAPKRDGGKQQNRGQQKQHLRREREKHRKPPVPAEEPLNCPERKEQREIQRAQRIEPAKTKSTLFWYIAHGLLKTLSLKRLRE